MGRLLVIYSLIIVISEYPLYNIKNYIYLENHHKEEIDICEFGELIDQVLGEERDHSVLRCSNLIVAVCERVLLDLVNLKTPERGGEQVWSRSLIQILCWFRGFNMFLRGASYTLLGQINILSNGGGMCVTYFLDQAVLAFLLRRNYLATSCCSLSKA